MTDPISTLRSICDAATQGRWTYGGSEVLGGYTADAETPQRGHVTVYREGRPEWVCNVPTEEIVKNGQLITTLANLRYELLAVISGAKSYRDGLPGVWDDDLLDAFDIFEAVSAREMNRRPTINGGTNGVVVSDLPQPLTPGEIDKLGEQSFPLGCSPDECQRLIATIESIQDEKKQLQEQLEVAEHCVYECVLEGDLTDEAEAIANDYQDRLQVALTTVADPVEIDIFP